MISANRRQPVLLLAAALCLAPFAGARAATHVVTTLTDAVPAPPGSLRAAIEASEGNGEPDRITFGVSGTIRLVAPLPDLVEGDLSINAGPSTGAVPAIRLSGNLFVPSALTSRGAYNAILDLEFEGFTKAAVRILGGGAVDNVVAGCRFGTFTPIANANRIGVQIAAETSGAGFPEGTRLAGLAFEGNDAAIRIEGNNSPAGTPLRPTQIVACDVGSRGLLPAGTNGEALHATAPVVVEDSRFAADGTAPNTPRGIYLGQGSGGSRILRSKVGLGRAPGPSAVCAGWNFTPAGITVENARDILIAENDVGCNAGDGISIGQNTRAIEVRDNDIGTAGAATAGGNAGNGIRLAAAADYRVFRNRIHDNGRFGIEIALAVEGGLVACNEMRDNASGLIDAPGWIGPPTFTAATATRIQGKLPDPGPGWVDVYSAAGPNAADLFLGSVPINNDTPEFRSRIPVDNIRFVPVAAVDPPRRCVTFDLDLGDRNLGTAYRADLEMVSQFSTEIGNPPTARAHDLLRGRVENLALTPGGTVALGPLECVASNVQPNQLPVCDDALPHPGFALFYVAVRRGLLANDAGSYDVPACGPFPTGQIATREGADVCQ